LQAFGTTYKEFVAEPRLERLYVLTNSGLGQANFKASAGEAQQSCGSFKTAQPIEIQIVTHWFGIKILCPWMNFISFYLT
jgi:hypothetical protein